MTKLSRLVKKLTDKGAEEKTCAYREYYTDFFKKIVHKNCHTQLKKWYYPVSKEGDNFAQWKDIIASDFLEQIKPHFHALQWRNDFKESYHFEIIYLSSLYLLDNPDYPIVIIDDKRYCDPSIIEDIYKQVYFNYINPDVLQTYFQVQRSKKNKDNNIQFERLLTAYLRCLHKENKASGQINPLDLMNEYQQVINDRTRYRERQESKEERFIARTARNNPIHFSERYREIRSMDSLEALQYRRVAHKNAVKRHSACYKDVMRIYTKDQLSTAIKRRFKTNKTYKVALELDFWLNLEKVDEIKQVLCKIIKNPGLNNKQVQQLFAIVLKPKMKYAYIAYLHDMRGLLLEIEYLLRHKVEAIAKNRFITGLLQELAGHNKPWHYILLLRKINAALGEGAIVDRGNDYKTNVQKLLKHAEQESLTTFDDALRHNKHLTVHNKERCAKNALILGILNKYNQLISSGRVQVNNPFKDIRIQENKIEVMISAMKNIDGWLAMGIPGICLDFAGAEQYLQLETDSLYITVWVNDEITASGLIVKTKHYYVLNNFQGQIPKKHQKKIQETLVKSFNHLDKPLLFHDLYFNAVNLIHWLDVKETPKRYNLSLPDIYLDIEMEEDLYKFTPSTLKA